eukprot:Selendium_serpulae@DN4502_c0_g1_i1.p1
MRQQTLFIEAWKEAIRREKEGSGCSVTFKIRYDTRFGQRVCVVGSDPALGAWDPGAALHMVWTDGNNWMATAKLGKSKKGRIVEYKYVAIEPNNVEWETGANHKIDLHHLKQGKTLVDQWGGAW